MADRYWVGGSGTWNTTSTTNWSTSSGGSSGASVPTTSDNVIFDQNSTYTVTLTGALSCANLTVSQGTVTFAQGTAPTLTVAGTAFNIKSGTVWNSTGTVTFTSTGSVTITTNSVTLSCGFTLNGAGGTFTLAGNLTLGTTRTFTLTAGALVLSNNVLTAGIFSSSNSNTRSIDFGSSGKIVLNDSSGTTLSILSMATSTNFSYAGTSLIELNASNASATKDIKHGGTESSAMNVSCLSSVAVTYNLDGVVKDLVLNGTNQSLAITAGSVIYGSLTNVGGTTAFASGGGVLTFGATSGTKTINSGGATVNFPLTINGSGGTFQLAANLSMISTRAFTHTNGTLDLNGKILTVGTQYVTASGTKNLTFNGGTVVCPAATTTAWNNAQPTNFTTTAGTGTGKISMTAATAKTFVGGGSIYNCTLSNDGAGALTVSGSNTFTTIANGVQPTTFTFTSGTTQTVTNWSVNGAAGNLVTIGATTTSAATLSKSSGTVSSDYLSLSYSTATGGASWYAGANSTDSGNNTGWIFAAAPSSSAKFMLLL
jgi:hypothetical protein